MTLEKQLSVMKKKMEQEFKDFKFQVEENKKTEHGKVINKLLTYNKTVLYLFENTYYQDDIGSMSYLFAVLNHAFVDDGEIYLKKILSPLSSKELGDFYQYAICIAENPKGKGLTYQQLDMLIEQSQKEYEFAKENEEVINKGWENLTAEEQIINAQYSEECRKKSDMLKAIYKENKYKKEKSKKKKK